MAMKIQSSHMNPIYWDNAMICLNMGYQQATVSCIGQGEGLEKNSFIKCDQ